MCEREREQLGKVRGQASALVRLSSSVQSDPGAALRGAQRLKWPQVAPHFSAMSDPWPLTPIWSEDYSGDLSSWELLSDMALSVNPVGTLSLTPESDLLFGIVCFPGKCLPPQFAWSLEGRNYVVFGVFKFSPLAPY